MTIGTKTLVFGVHNVVLHPLAVLICWLRMYGWPKWHELLAIIVHDWGYWGCPDIDGDDGVEHPAAGARIAYRIVLRITRNKQLATRTSNLILGHSRHYAKRYNVPFSKLLGPDKMSAVLYPWYIYIPMAWLSGELESYRYETSKLYWATGIGVPVTSLNRTWYAWMQKYIPTVVANPKDANYYLRARQ